MATLQQTLRGLPKADDQLTRGPGGVLQRSPTLKQATQQAGLAATPTTPMAAQMTGASAQAAKMAGTPQQMQAALQQASEQSTLQTALRQKQYGREVTGAEAAAMSKSADMQKLGGLGDRVTKLIEAQKTAQLVAPADTGAALQTQATEGTVLDVQFAGKPVKNVASDLEKLRTLDPLTNAAEYNELLKKINTYFGRTETNLLTTEELNTLYKSSSEILQAVSEDMQLRLPTVEELTSDPDFGYTLEQLSGLLNIPATDLAGYTSEQLQNVVNQIQADEFSRVEQLERQAGSPLVGAAERGLAMEAARELSAAGVRASEADMQNLIEDITSANTITFNNQLYTVEQIVGDDFISDIIKKYVDSPANSDFRKQLDKAEPELSRFINTHINALTTAAQGLKAGTSQLSSIQTANAKLFADAGITSEVVSKLSPSLAGIQTSAITADQVPTISYLNSLTDKKQKDDANKILKDLVTNNPQLLEEIGKLNLEQLQSLGIGKPGSNYEKMINYNTALQELESIAENDYDRLIQKAFSDVTSLDTAQLYVTEGNMLRALGLDSGVSVTSLNPATLKKDLLQGKSSVSLTDAAAGKVPEVAKQTLGKPKTAIGMDLDLITKLGPLLQDGVLSHQDMYSAGSPVPNLSLDELIRLEELSTNGKSFIDPKGISNLRQQKTTVNTREQFNNAAAMVDMSSIFNHINVIRQLTQSDPSGKRIDRELLSGELEKIIKTDIDEALKIVKGWGGYDNIKNKEAKQLVTTVKRVLGEAMSADAATPAMYRAYYDILGGVPVFSM